MLNDEQQSVHKINKGSNIFKQHEPNSDEYRIITKCLLQPWYKYSGNTCSTQMSMDLINLKILFCISKLALGINAKKCYKNPDEYHNVTNLLLQSCNQYTGNTCLDKLGFYFPMFKRYMLVFPRSIYFTLHVWIYVCECKHHHYSYFN